MHVVVFFVVFRVVETVPPSTAAPSTAAPSVPASASSPHRPRAFRVSHRPSHHVLRCSSCHRPASSSLNTPRPGVGVEAGAHHDGGDVIVQCRLQRARLRGCPCPFCTPGRSRLESTRSEPIEPRVQALIARPSIRHRTQLNDSEMPAFPSQSFRFQCHVFVLTCLFLMVLCHVPPG